MSTDRSSWSTSAHEDYKPSNMFVSAMLTDLYQLTMAYAYWKTERHDVPAVFDLLFRKNPFNGEFTIFAGLDECLRHLNTFGFAESDIAHLRQLYPQWDSGFWQYLGNLDASRFKVYAFREGAVMFPRTPMIRVEGPLAAGQLLETTFLVLVNFPSLITTNAARHRIAAGPDKGLLEFGLRRAQGPDGAISASRYAHIGGFDATSNVKAGQMFGIDIRGTHAHSFISSFTSLQDLKFRTMMPANGTGKEIDFVELCQAKLAELLTNANTNEGELAGFICYAQTFPNKFLALVDTYDTINSGMQNFLAVALALHELGYKPLGIRLDSGDLAYLSNECRRMFKSVSERFEVPFEKLTIVASNDLNEEVLYALESQGHEIDAFGIGTNLVTCQGQPALGCVYKLVEINGIPRIKVSQDKAKVTIPGRKCSFRLFGKNDEGILDLMVREGSEEPQAGKRVLCRHPFDSIKRAYVTPSRVERLDSLVWDGKLVGSPQSLRETKEYCKSQLESVREDHKRHLNPTPYKVSVSEELFDFVNDLWQSAVPIPEIKS